MKTPLKSRVARPTAEDALRIAGATAPLQPPAQVKADDGATTLNLRVRKSTVDSLAAVARSRGMTLKQVVVHALAASGVEVAAADLEDRTPRRQR